MYIKLIFLIYLIITLGEFMKKAALVLLVALFGFYPAVSFADGPYIAINGGMTKFSDSDLLDTGSGVTHSLEFESNVNAAASLGFKIGAFRAEGEFHYKLNRVIRSNQPVPLGGNFAANGELQTFSIMGNLFYDHQLNKNLAIYLGGGAGVTRVDLKFFDVTPTSIKTIDDKDDVFSYQFMGGLSSSFDSNPNLIFSFGYRYFNTANGDFSITPTAAAPFTAGGQFVDVSFEAHELNFGVRYQF